MRETGLLHEIRDSDPLEAALTESLGGGLEDPFPVLARLFSAHFHADLQTCRFCCLTLYMMIVILLIMTTVMYRRLPRQRKLEGINESIRHRPLWKRRACPGCRNAGPGNARGRRPGPDPRCWRERCGFEDQVRRVQALSPISPPTHPGDRRRWGRAQSRSASAAIQTR